MDRFGEQWRDHIQKIQDRWRALVKDSDVVLVAGDISWAMRLREALPDLMLLHQLPGRKILIRGNHDYWWQSIRQVRAALPEGMFALQNDHLVFDQVAICGARGWNIPIPDSPTFEDDQRLFMRERQRLDMSLRSVPRDLPKIAMLHFPPISATGSGLGFGDILEQNQVQVCVFGHLHGSDHAWAFSGEMNGVRYIFCAADAVGFTPTPVFI